MIITPAPAFFDLLNPNSYPEKITQLLKEHETLLYAYHNETDGFEIRNRNDPTVRWVVNRHSSSYDGFIENHLLETLEKFQLRVWHYTRLLDAEADDIKDGLKPASSEFLRDRLVRLVGQHLTQAQADRILSASVYNQQPIRQRAFWTISHPNPIACRSVGPLLSHWGGEGAYFWLTDEDLKTRLQTIGRARVLELLTPIPEKYIDAIAHTIVLAWIKSPDAVGYDMDLQDVLPEVRVRHVHTEGDELFDQIGKTYPYSPTL